MSKKSDKLNLDIRVRNVVEWILAGHFSSDIVTQCMNKWTISERQAYTYINKAKKILAETRKGEMSERIDFYVSAQFKLFNGLKEKDTPNGARVANEIIMSMAKLEGCLSDKLDVTTKGDKLPSTTPVIKITTVKSIEDVQTDLG